MKIRHWLLAACAAAGTAAQAHVNVAPDNAFFLGEAPREYLEGKSAFLSINLPHSCSNPDTGKRFATTDVALLLPNGSGLAADVAYTADRQGKVYGANAMMGTKARVSATWKKVLVRKGEVQPFYSHGLKSEDARAVYWLKSYVDNAHYDNLEIRTHFPHLSGCTARLKVYVPAAQYCKKGYRIAWIGTADSSVFQPDAKTRVEDHYAPYFYVVRDTVNNPLPAACGDGQTVEVRPSVEEIDAYLPLPRGEHGHGRHHGDD